MPTTATVIHAVSSAELHNRNCFNYLRSLNISESVLATFPPELRQPLSILRGKKATDYDSQFAYADLYSKFFGFIESEIDNLYPPDFAEKTKKRRQALEGSIETMASSDTGQAQSQLPAVINLAKNELVSLDAQKGTADDWDRFIISIYNNDNNILVDTYEAIKHIPLAHTPIQKGIEHRITEHTKDNGKSVNRTAKSPAYAGSMLGRLSSMLSDTFKPQHDTSLATVRRYSWNNSSSIIEQRIGTQGQRHDGKSRVSPLYERYLECEARQTTSPEKITNVYINNLGRDRTGLEGEKESALTSALEQLEARHSNIAVITLPADQGLMSSSLHEKTELRHEYAAVKNEFLLIASQDSNAKRKIKDFYISPKIRERVFIGVDGKYSLASEKEHLSKLLDKSFKAMGIASDSRLSDAQQQAVWFHFVKFAVPDHVIGVLNPKYINFSCKDAIDRGGVSSAYYNLVKSFGCNDPMSRDEFEQALHAAPAMVKGRGINHHIKLIWNTIDNYVNTEYETIKNDSDKAWLIEWRDANCPHARVDNYLSQRVEQVTKDLQEANSAPQHLNKSASIKQGLNILAAIKEHSAKGVSGKRLLLEAATSTQAIALNPTESNLAAYSKLIDKLSVNPVLNVIGGLMKTLAGLALTIVTLGKVTAAKEITAQGIATTKSGIEYKSRQSLQADMRKQLNAIKKQNQSEPNNSDAPSPIIKAP